MVKESIRMMQEVKRVHMRHEVDSRLRRPLENKVREHKVEEPIQEDKVLIKERVRENLGDHQGLRELMERQ